MVGFAILDEFLSLIVTLLSEPDVLADEQEALGMCSPQLFRVIQGISKFFLAVDDSGDGLLELFAVVFNVAVRIIQLWDDLF